MSASGASAGAPRSGAVVWLNGRVLPLAEARISPLDRGFLHGDGAFETLRAYRGKPFLLDAHLDRLELAGKELALPLPDRATLARAVGEVLRANALAEARVRITVSRGEDGPDLWPEAPVPTVLVTAQPVALPSWLYERGAAVVTSSLRVPARAHSKSTSFQAHVLAKGEARRAGAWEALLLNDRGEVAEGATSNVFALLDGEVVTPPTAAGALAGITRAAVLRLAQPALCLGAREAVLRPRDLLAAREVFLCSSVAEVVPVVRVDGQAVGDGHPGPVTRAVLDAYRAEVARACA